MGAAPCGLPGPGNLTKHPHPSTPIFTPLQLDIACDSFIRTTDAKHEALVAAVLDRVWEKGDIYKANYEGYYCVDCEEYKDEADMDAGWLPGAASGWLGCGHRVWVRGSNGTVCGVLVD